MKKIFIIAYLYSSAISADIAQDIQSLVKGASSGPCQDKKEVCPFQKTHSKTPLQGDQWHLLSSGLDFFKKDPAIKNQKINDNVGIIEVGDLAKPLNESLGRKFDQSAAQTSSNSDDHGLMVAQAVNSEQEGANQELGLKFAKITNENDVRALLDNPSIKVINVSLKSTNGRVDLLEKLAIEAGKKGKTIIWAAANDGKKYSQNLTVQTPILKKSANIMVVGALSSVGGPAEFSNKGEHVDFYFPGEGLLFKGQHFDSSFDAFNQKERIQGTSFAAPKFSAVLASFMNLYPQYSFNEWKDLLALSSLEKGPYPHHGVTKVPNPYLLLTTMKEGQACHHLGLQKVSCLQNVMASIKKKNQKMPLYDGSGRCEELHKYYDSCRKNYFLSGGELNIETCINHIFPEHGRYERLAFLPKDKFCKRSLEIAVARNKYKNDPYVKYQLDYALSMCGEVKRDETYCHEKTLKEADHSEKISNQCFMKLCEGKFHNRIIDHTHCEDTFYSFSLEKKKEILKDLMAKESLKKEDNIEGSFLNLLNSASLSDEEQIQLFPLLTQYIHKLKDPAEKKKFLRSIDRFLYSSHFSPGPLLEQELSRIADNACTDLNIVDHKDLLTYSAHECQKNLKIPEKDLKNVEKGKISLQDFLTLHPKQRLSASLIDDKNNEQLILQHFKEQNYNHPNLDIKYGTQIASKIPLSDSETFINVILSDSFGSMSFTQVEDRSAFLNALNPDQKKTALKIIDNNSSWKRRYEKSNHSLELTNENQIYEHLFSKNEICKINKMKDQEKKVINHFIDNLLAQSKTLLALKDEEREKIDQIQGHFDKRYGFTLSEFWIILKNKCSTKEFSNLVFPSLFDNKKMNTLFSLMTSGSNGDSDGTISPNVIRYLHGLRQDNPKKLTDVLNIYEQNYLTKKIKPLSLTMIAFLSNFKEGKEILARHQEFIEKNVDCDKDVTLYYPGDGSYAFRKASGQLPYCK
jgi:hypothetical protein